MCYRFKEKKNIYCDDKKELAHFASVSTHYCLLRKAPKPEASCNWKKMRLIWTAMETGSWNWPKSHSPETSPAVARIAHCAKSPKDEYRGYTLKTWRFGRALSVKSSDGRVGNVDLVLGRSRQSNVHLLQKAANGAQPIQCLEGPLRMNLTGCRPFV